MNRRTFLTNALALGAVAGLIGTVTETFSFPMKESSLTGLLNKLAKQPKQRIGVFMDSAKIHKFVFEFVKNHSQVGNIINSGFRHPSVLMLWNDTTIEFFPINEPERLCGPQWSSSIIVGKPKYPELKHMVRIGTRLGDSPVVYELE